MGGEFLRPDSVYKVASTAYVAVSGKDGFQCMLPNKVVIALEPSLYCLVLQVILPEDEGPAISALVQNHFEVIQPALLCSVEHFREWPSGCEAGTGSTDSPSSYSLAARGSVNLSPLQ